MTATTGSTTLLRRWPAEYEPHFGCILLFPKPSQQTAYTSSCDTTSATRLIVQAQNAVLDVISAIVLHGQEDVYLFCDIDDERNHQSSVITYLQQRNLPFVVTFDHPMAATVTSTTCSCNDEDDDDDSTTKVYLMLCPSEDTWARDTGPTFVVKTTIQTNITNDVVGTETSRLMVGLDWDFNAYGGKDDGCYWPYKLDEQVAWNMIQSINQYYNRNINSNDINIPSPLILHHEKIASLILEGGSIHTDGEGTILTTKECLLHPNRNPNLTQDQIERIVLQATGCNKMIWLEHGLAYDDDTNGHIDNWACFVKPTHIVLAWTDDMENDPINYKNCRESFVTLQNSTDAHNRSLTIHKMYLPSPPIRYNQNEDDTVTGTATTNATTTRDTYMEDATATNAINDNSTSTTTTPSATVERIPGTQMAASYVNFYIANEAVIAPQFNDPIYDIKAIDLLQSLFSNTNNDYVNNDNDDESPKMKHRSVIGIKSSRHILYGGGNIHCITQQIPT